MSKPVDISPDAFKAAWKCAEFVLRNLPDDYGDVSPEIEAIARAIMVAKAEEREAILQFEFDLPCTGNGADMMVAIREYIRSRGEAP